MKKLIFNTGHLINKFGSLCPLVQLVEIPMFHKLHNNTVFTRALITSQRKKFQKTIQPSYWNSPSFFSFCLSFSQSQQIQELWSTRTQKQKNYNLQTIWILLLFLLSLCVLCRQRDHYNYRQSAPPYTSLILL